MLSYFIPPKFRGSPGTATPIFAWLRSALAPPVRPNCLFPQCPFVAFVTDPGTPRLGSQHPGVDCPSVSGILFCEYQVATRRGTPPRTADTICHVGTNSFDDLAISCTPLDKVSLVNEALCGFTPSSSTFCRISSGPPLFMT